MGDVIQLPKPTEWPWHDDQGFDATVLDFIPYLVRRYITDEDRYEDAIRESRKHPPKPYRKAKEPS